MDMTREQMVAEIARLKAEMASKPRGLTLRVSEKGALSVYGMGRFPVTLYAGQWSRLIEVIPTIQAFMVENTDKLAVKEAK